MEINHTNQITIVGKISTEYIFAGKFSIGLNPTIFFCNFFESNMSDSTIVCSNLILLLFGLEVCLGWSRVGRCLN